MEFGGVTNVLRVRDVSVSLDYFVRALGFKINFQVPNREECDFASVSRGKCCLFLSAGEQGNPGSWVWIDGKDVEALYEEYRASGAKIRNPPTNYPWALEVQVEDPDGNILQIGSDLSPMSPPEVGPICAAIAWNPRPVVDEHGLNLNERNRSTSFHP